MRVTYTYLCLYIELLYMVSYMPSGEYFSFVEGSVEAKRLPCAWGSCDFYRYVNITIILDKAPSLEVGNNHRAQELAPQKAKFALRGDVDVRN